MSRKLHFLVVLPGGMLCTRISSRRLSDVDFHDSNRRRDQRTSMNANCGHLRMNTGKLIHACCLGSWSSVGLQARSGDGPDDERLCTPWPRVATCCPWPFLACRVTQCWHAMLCQTDHERARPIRYDGPVKYWCNVAWIVALLVHRWLASDGQHSFFWATCLREQVE